MRTRHRRPFAEDALFLNCVGTAQRRTDAALLEMKNLNKKREGRRSNNSEAQ